MREIFPDLEITLRVRFKKLRRAIASYDDRVKRIDIDPRPFTPDPNLLLPSVLAHETMHALQYSGRGVPHGERACDIFMFARLPTTLYPRRREFYVDVPQKILSNDPERIKHTATRAIKLREDGLRNYIVWFETELRR